MASHHAIAATTTAVHRLLADAGAQDADWQTADISILQADELQNPVSAEKPRISVYLYRVNASVARHGRWPRTGPAGQRVLAPVIVDLHYLVPPGPGTRPPLSNSSDGRSGSWATPR